MRMEFCFLGGILLAPPSKDCFGDAAFTGGGFETFTPTSSSPWNLSLRDARTPPRASAGTEGTPTFLESTSTLPGVVTVLPDIAPAWVLDAMPHDGVSPRAGVAPVTGKSPVSPCATSASATVASSSIASAAACSIILSTLLVPSAPPPIKPPSSPSSTLLNESARLKLRRG